MSGSSSEPNSTHGPLVLGVSDFVAFLNQTLEFAYPGVTIAGELANFRVSKNKWVYFDLKDELASVKFFGTVYQLPGPLEDGLMLEVTGMPRLHPQYGFSVNVLSMRPVGEGSIKRAASLLEAKLAKEGLFDESRKRALPYPPNKIGLIASAESAAYADFLKILSQRFGGIEIDHVDVQVQGEQAPSQIIAALEYLNTGDSEVIIITRGGGSSEDLAAFSTEQVTRAVAASRAPTLVAVGHEIDVSLAELAADRRGSTPSNAAELLVPDKKQLLSQAKSVKKQLDNLLDQIIIERSRSIRDKARVLTETLEYVLSAEKRRIELQSRLLKVLNPDEALKRGYAVVRHSGKTVRSAKQIKKSDLVTIQFSDDSVSAEIR